MSYNQVKKVDQQAFMTMKEPSSEEKIASLKALLRVASSEKEIARIKAKIAAEEQLQKEIEAWAELLWDYYDSKRNRGSSE